MKSQQKEKVLLLTGILLYAKYFFKKRLKQEKAVVLQLGYPRYRNNPLCKTVVWCRIQSYFKDLPKENCAKWEKSPSCFTPQNKPNWKYLKGLASKRKTSLFFQHYFPCFFCSARAFNRLGSFSICTNYQEHQNVWWNEKILKTRLLQLFHCQI